MEVVFAITEFLDKIGAELSFFLLLVLFFALQLFFCFKIKRLIFKLFPLFLCVLGGFGFLYCIKFSQDSWDTFGCVVLAVWCGYAFLSCLGAWLVFAIAKRAKKEKP